MKVDLYVDPAAEPYAQGIALEEAIPDAEERALAELQLDLEGKLWCGGGSAQAVLIVVSR